MPQLMPLMWNLSTMMLFFLVLVGSLMYGMMEGGKVKNSILNKEKVNQKWFW